MQQNSSSLAVTLISFRDGDAITVPAAGVSGRGVKAGGADPLWLDLGVLSDVGVTPSQEEREVYAPQPGKLVLYDVIPTKHKREIKLALMQMSPIVWENPFRHIAFGFNPEQAV